MTGKSKKTATSAPEEAISAGQEALNSFVNSNQQAYQKIFGDSQKKFENAMASYGGFGGENNASMEAVVTAGQTYAKGIETLTAEWFAFSKSMIEANVAASKDAFAAKSLTDALELQSAHMQKTSEEVMAQSAKVGEMSSKILRDVVAPINVQVSEAMEKFTKVAA